jgi:hypothetical protein
MVWPIYHIGISCGHLISAHIQHFFVFLKERLKDTKREIRIRESKDMRYIYQKKYDKKAINDLQNTTQKTKDRAFRIPLKDIQVPRKSRQILLHVWYLSCYTYYKPSDMSWTRKWLCCGYDNRSEWVSDCCLTLIQQFFSYIIARTS